MKAIFKLRCLLTVLILLAGLHTAFAQPTLGIAPAGKQSVLYWPNTPTNYLLQSATDLASPNWAYANDAVTVNAATVSNTSPTKFFRLVFTNAPAGMALIPAGSFTMGNSIGDNDITDAAPVNVYVSTFYMDVNLVSDSKWQTVYSYATNHGYSFSENYSDVDNYPTLVRWHDAVKWCNARSQMEGLTPIYFTDLALIQVYKTGEGNIQHLNLGNSGYRLPTEAEWEKAARGGLNGRRFPWGNRIDANLANYYRFNHDYSYDFGPVDVNSGTWSLVGSYDVNGYGLYDMAGNEFEWCWDWYATPYSGGSNPRGPATGTKRVFRGGAFYYTADSVRCAFRAAGLPGSNSFDRVSFRCARGL